MATETLWVFVSFSPFILKLYLCNIRLSVWFLVYEFLVWLIHSMFFFIIIVEMFDISFNRTLYLRQLLEKEAKNFSRLQKLKATLGSERRSQHNVTQQRPNTFNFPKSTLRRKKMLWHLSLGSAVVLQMFLLNFPLDKLSRREKAWKGPQGNSYG